MATLDLSKGNEFYHKDINTPKSRRVLLDPHDLRGLSFVPSSVENREDHNKQVSLTRGRHALKQNVDCLSDPTEASRSFRLKGRILKGAIIKQNHRHSIWPYCLTPLCEHQDIRDYVDKSRYPDQLFDIEWVEAQNLNEYRDSGYWVCRKEGYGDTNTMGGYGYGCLIVLRKEDVEIVEIVEIVDKEDNVIDLASKRDEIHDTITQVILELQNLIKQESRSLVQSVIERLTKEKFNNCNGVDNPYVHGQLISVLQATCIREVYAEFEKFSLSE